MRILIDMDGVTVRLLPTWVRAYNDATGGSLKAEDVTSWRVHDFMPLAGKHEVYGYINRPGFFDYLPAMPGAVEAITQLHEDGHSIRFATSAPGADAARGKIAWVERMFAHLGYGASRVILTHDKSWINADVLIDDKPDTIHEWVDAGRQIIAPVHPYNEARMPLAAHAIHGITTGEGWDRIGQLVDQMSTLEA